MKQRTIKLDTPAQRAIAAEAVLNTPDKPKMECVIRPLRRSNEANAYYWAAVVTPLAEFCGYTTGEMHEELLGLYYGWELREFMGEQRKYPRRRTTTDESGQHDVTHKIDFMGLTQLGQEIMAKYGVSVENR